MVRPTFKITLDGKIEDLIETYPLQVRIAPEENKRVLFVIGRNQQEILVKDLPLEGSHL